MLSILIVEDNNEYRHWLSELLVERFAPLQIIEAEDAQEALRHAHARHFDLIFMDIRLPRGNGLDLTRTIKAIDANSVICVLTASDLPEYREAALVKGADRFMVKGDSTQADFVDVVESLLGPGQSP